jgi:hypothetical protein
MALTDNLISYWKLNEQSGTRYDETASNNDLTDNNTVGYGTGKIGNAADFESTNSESLSIDDAAQTGLDLTGDFTFSLWVNFESHNYFGLISKYASAGDKRAYNLETVITAGAIYRLNLAISSDGVTPVEKYVAFAPNLATWYHIAVVYDASAGTADFYINGTAQTQQTGLPTSIYNNDQKFNIGSHNGGQYMDGLIDEVGIWNRTLSSSEITSLYNGGSGFAYPFSTTTTVTPHLLASTGVGS